MATIHRKSAKGVAEIDTRAHRLPPRVRSLLILVDGKRSDDELRAMVPQADEALALLQQQGFIEPVAPAAVAPAAAPPAQPAAPGAPAPAGASVAVPFATLRLMAVRLLNDQLGPSGETLAMKMEKTRSVDELRPLLGQAARLIGQARGNAAAAAYAARFEGL